MRRQYGEDSPKPRARCARKPWPISRVPDQSKRREQRKGDLWMNRVRYWNAVIDHARRVGGHCLGGLHAASKGRYRAVPCRFGFHRKQKCEQAETAAKGRAPEACGSSQSAYHIPKVYHAGFRAIAVRREKQALMQRRTGALLVNDESAMNAELIA